MKFLGKWLDLEGIILREVTQSQKNSDAPQQRNGYRKCGTFTQWSNNELLKRMNL